MKIVKKQIALGLIVFIGFGGLVACKQSNTPLQSTSIEINESSEQKDIKETSSEDVLSNVEMEKEYDKMTKDEKISYLEDKIFNMRVKARSLEMKLEENPQYSNEKQEEIQEYINKTDELIEKINKQIDKLENK